MENNSDRMGFALIALSVVAFVLLAVNGPLKSTVDGFFDGFKDWQTQTFDGINESNKPDVTHTAYSWSSDGTDRFTTTKPNLNLLKGTRTPNSLTGNNVSNQVAMLYQFDNGKDVQNQGLSVGDTMTCEFDWTVSNPTSGTFLVQLNGTNWKQLSQTISITSENKSGHSELSFVVDAGFLAGVANRLQLRADYLPTDSVLTISNVVFTKGSTATPWMPSASEVKPSDQPKYIGTYTDKNESASQKPSDYTWKVNPDYHE